jgi:hypothetical protein
MRVSEEQATASWPGCGVGREAGFSAAQFAKTRTAPVEMTVFWWFELKATATAKQQQPQRQWQLQDNSYCKISGWFSCGGT